MQSCSRTAARAGHRPCASPAAIPVGAGRPMSSSPFAPRGACLRAPATSSLATHQLMHDGRADADREREQPLPRCPDELAGRLPGLGRPRTLWLPVRVVMTVGSDRLDRQAVKHDRWLSDMSSGALQLGPRVVERAIVVGIRDYDHRVPSGAGHLTCLGPARSATLGVSFRRVDRTRPCRVRAGPRQADDTDLSPSRSLSSTPSRRFRIRSPRSLQGRHRLRDPRAMRVDRGWRAC